MISTLGQKMMEMYQTDHFADILTATNRAVSHQVTKLGLGGNGQVIQRVDQLSKKLFLRTDDTEPMTTEADYIRVYDHALYPYMVL